LNKLPTFFHAVLQPVLKSNNKSQQQAACMLWELWESPDNLHTWAWSYC